MLNQDAGRLAGSKPHGTARATVIPAAKKLHAELLLVIYPARIPKTNRCHHPPSALPV